MQTTSMMRLKSMGFSAAIAALLISLFLPIVAFQNVAQAATVTARSIDINSSEPNVETDYEVAFTLPASSTVGSFTIEFCNNDPLPGESCTYTDEGDDIPCVATEENAAAADCGSAVTLSGFAMSNATGCTAATIQAPAVDENFISIDCTAGGAEATAGDEVVTFTLQNVDNPNNDTSGNANDTFYARLYTFAATTAPAYVNPVVAANNDGGVALSTAQVITIDAKVQEVLNFCVGTIIATSGDCATISGSSIDLGILDATALTTSADLDQTGGTANTCDFDDTSECVVMVITTNATDDGVVVEYRAESLDVGDLCTPAGSPASDVDQCINDAGATEATLVAGTEAWGIAIIEDTNDNAASATNTNLQRAANYDFDTADEYALVDTDTPTTIASTATSCAPAACVVDREQLEVEVAAAIGFTTPSGTYQGTLEFIATGTF